jgi:hypothetical protein
MGLEEELAEVTEQREALNARIRILRERYQVPDGVPLSDVRDRGPDLDQLAADLSNLIERELKLGGRG